MPAQTATRQEFIDKFTEEIIHNIAKNFSAIEKEKRAEERIKREEEINKLKEKFSKEVVNMQPVRIQLPSNMIPKPVQQEQKPIQQKQIPQIQQQALVQFKKPQQQQNPKKEEKPKPTNIEAPKILPQVALGEIDFGKIIYLIKDLLITYIECPGPDKNVIIRKAGNSFMTQIKLTKDEMIAIIKSFSLKTRIPLVEGMLTARYENIEISAIVSETTTSSFIIKKDIIPPVKMPPTQLQPPNQPYIRPGMPRPMRFPIPGIQMPPTLPRHQTFQAKPQQAEPKKESIWNKKIKIGK